MEKNECFSFLQITDSHLFSEEKKMFGVNYNKLINWLLPKEWRQTRHIAWLRALIAPLKNLHSQLTLLH